MANFKFIHIGKNSISMFTGKLRWHGRILEQEVAYQDYDGGVLVGGHNEWQPVPNAPKEIHVDGTAESDRSGGGG